MIRKVEFRLALVVGFMAWRALTASPEATYAEAVVAYHGRHWEEALKIVEEGLKETPRAVNLLELQALIYKASQNYPKAYESFHELLEMSLRNQTNGRKKSFYQFELGLVEYERKEYGPAKIFLKRALADDFNSSASHYFLGLIEFQSKAYHAAKEHFLRVASSNIEELKLPSQLYLGQIYSEENAAQPALKQFFAAREGARRLAASASPDTRTLAQQVLAGAERSLKGVSSGGYYGRVGMATEYDSNVLLAPSLSSANSGGVTSEGTIKEVLQAGLGFTSSPLEKLQWLPSFRTSYNYNSNPDTRAGQFLTNDLALFVNLDPLNKFSWGAKAEGLLIYRNGDGSGNASSSLTAYSLLGSVGPYLHYDASALVTVGADVYFQPQRYFSDDSSDSDYAKSGLGYRGRVFISRDQHSDWDNPSISVGAEIQNTSGTEYRSKALLVELADVLYFSSRTRLVPSLSAGAYFYTDRIQGFRRDLQWAFGATLSHSLLAQLEMNLAAIYTSNQSTVDDVYTYKRLVTSLGASYYF